MQSFSSGQFILADTYRIEKMLGRGAFGEVYLATLMQLSVPRAIKVIRKGDAGLGSTEFEQYRERFRVEAKLGATLHHQNIVHVDDFREEDNELYLIMDYASGGSLAEKIEKNINEDTQIPIDQAVKWISEAAEGLSKLHKRDIVHRDIKPSNILLDSEGNACIADLGLVQLPTSRTLGSSFGQNQPGTPEYMPPEQRPGNYMPLLASADVYALGCVLFELLTGRQYYHRPEGTRVKSIRSEVPDWLDGLIDKALSAEAKNRYYDAEALLEALKQTHSVVSTPVAIPAPIAISTPVVVPDREINRKVVKKAPIIAKQSSNGNEMSFELAPGVLMKFVRIPAGEFLMGSDPKTDRNAQKDEQPLHKVYLDEYWIGKYPVTNRQYQVFTQYGNSPAPRYWPKGQVPDKKIDRPVVGVSWEDARVFCKWLSGRTGKRIALPTEAQWEKAARGTDGRIYPWGNQAPDTTLANYNKNVGHTTLVGNYPTGASPFGAQDMAGNVWEWVADWYDANYYQNCPKNNPTGLSSRGYHVLRGGSWNYKEFFIRAANRYEDYRSNTYGNDGFRCSFSENVS